MVERRPVQKPTSLGSRQVQLTQLEKRYSSTFKKVSDSSNGTTVRLAMKPTDPDFPYDLELLQLQMLIPTDYPSQPASIIVMNSDIPKGFAINLERGFDTYTTTANTTLVRQLSWLDRNMEQLLQQQPATTMRFVSHSKKSKEMVAPALPDHIINNAAAGTTSSQFQQTSSYTSNVDTSYIKPSSPVKPMIDLIPTAVSTTTTTTTTTTTAAAAAATATTATSSYSDADLAAAFGRRSREIDQLKTRLGSSFRASKSERTLLFVSFHLTDPDFTHDTVFDDGIVRLRYHVPLQYPLLPCYIDIDNKNIGKSTSSLITQAFSQTDTITPLLRPVRPQQVRPQQARLPVVKSSSSPQQKSLFVDDQTRNKVILVNDPSLAKPPGMTSDDDNKNQYSSDSSTASDHEDSKQEEEEGEEASSSTTNGFENTVDLENILPEANETNDKKNINKKERWTTCQTCHSIIGVKFLSELIHANASSIGLLQLAGCTAFDVLGSSFMGTCGNCMDDMKHSIRLAPHDRPTTQACYNCHTKLTMALNEYRFVNIGQGGERLVADEAQVMKLKNKRKPKDTLLTVGQALPNEGTCSHYQKSKRWFRFSCCGKLYACDTCHDKEEDHVFEMAIRHVCGLCSKEQSAVGNKPCIGCGHEFDKATGKGAFWEGGHGVRNRNLMNRNDPHKHKNLNKTGSKKQDRVGLTGKLNREKEKQRQNDI
ncbi:uncharacterized protein BX664DRAFT_295443 [Halteromyces radiatus]|uniref:uncharacterized protein n=1 Tax=Halteromyces radiatus TaxID=101107 RepID=UPI0022209D05|nr:uncharacterized protein BX664DRAFT_295443 [Halteromyces radiatus]KAI8093593.1 hypothetical protein BX664DRAFT_295443 [Halteromyces radiatus]